jgi:hypothetical protein
VTQSFILCGLAVSTAFALISNNAESNDAELVLAITRRLFSQSCRCSVLLWKVQKQKQNGKLLWEMEATHAAPDAGSQRGECLPKKVKNLAVEVQPLLLQARHAVCKDMAANAGEVQLGLRLLCSTAICMMMHLPI